MADSLATEPRYFKRGAKIKTAFRRELEARAMPVQTVADTGIRGEAYRIAMANIRKPWARRWLKENRYVR